MADQVIDPQVPNPTPEPTPEPPKQPTGPTPEQIEEIQKKAFGHTFNLIDSKLAELGHIKPDGMKTTDFIAELLTKKSEPTGTKPDPQKVDDSELSAKFKALQEKYQAKEAELEQIKTSTATAKRDYWLESTINALPIETPDHLSEEERTRMMRRTQRLIKQELSENYQIKEVEGQFRFFSKDGTPILDGTVNMEPIKPSELISKEFSGYLAKAKSAPTPAGTGGQGSKPTPSSNVIPSKVKTATEFYTYLKEEKKMTLGSPEFTEQLKLAKEERPAMFS